ncbi:hypothetical protein BO94DRAFT_617059 [Aspergillus sclerotioniger CBS 115572]|uniref:Uncharacterized protein n=1 Tax=Aspergillus sclerotioniger CBS 115572 TaxID=1450535 RepID=A0A317X452_9EURO|nr:hypothetical protein BO94DRAFT_617059 [Aspergillus sclerotioniger CBS 115572]PWY91728.1 hypothetical protein BO94DRAFT_617059 [Aspergillus sclerotioniger CBS 115572]
MTSWSWECASAGLVDSTEFATLGKDFLDDFLEKLETDDSLRDWLATPGSGGAVTTQDIHYQESGLANTMVQEASEQGHSGITPDTSNIFPDQAIAMDQANLDNYGISMAYESGSVPALEDYDTAAVLDELEVLNSGQFDVSAISQGGIMSSAHPSMSSLHASQANELPANYYGCATPNMIGTVAASSQHLAMKQAGNAFSQPYSSSPFYSYGTSTMDNGSMSSYVSTPMEQTAPHFVNVPNTRFNHGLMSQMSTPPSQRAAAGLAQGFVTPINQINRPNTNRSDTASSGNSQNMRRYNAAPLMAQAVTGAASHFITIPTPVCQTMNPSQQQVEGKSTGKTKLGARSPANNSSASGSGPDMNSSPPAYLPGQLGTVNGVQGSVSGSSGSSVKRYTSPRVKPATTPVPSIVQNTGDRNVTASSPSVSSSPTPVAADTATQIATALRSPASLPRPSVVPDIVQLMDPVTFNVDVETTYSSLTEAREANRTASGPREDDTLPTTDIQKRAIVKALTNAMLSTKSAEDNPGMVKPFHEGKFGSARVEAVCWELLESVIARHTSGSLLACYGIKRKGSGESMTFTERMTRILQCLSTQKTICKHLLDPLYMHQFVDDPLSAYKRVIANKTLNKRKGEVMNAGKQVLGAKRTNATTTQSQEVKREEPNSSINITPTNTPGSATVNRRKIFATPTATFRQTAANLARHAANNNMLPGTMDVGAHASLAQAARGSPSLSLGRMPTTNAHTNRMMGATSHPRQNVAFNSLTPNSQPPSHVKPLDTLYDPEAMLGSLIQRNMSNPNANPNANPNMNPGMASSVASNMTPSMAPSMNPGMKSRMNTGVNPNANPKMMHANVKNPNTQARQQQQAPGATTGPRKRTLSDTNFEDQPPSAKRQH